jgi:hypothetical protein
MLIYNTCDTLINGCNQHCRMHSHSHSDSDSHSRQASHSSPISNTESSVTLSTQSTSLCTIQHHITAASEFSSLLYSPTRTHTHTYTPAPDATQITLGLNNVEPPHSHKGSAPEGGSKHPHHPPQQREARQAAEQLQACALLPPHLRYLRTTHQQRERSAPTPHSLRTAAATLWARLGAEHT